MQSLNTASALVAQAEEAERAGDRERAAALALDALSAPGDDGAMVALSRLLSRLRRPRRALTAAERAVAIAPANAAAHLRHAQALRAVGAPGEALAAAERATRLAPLDAGNWILSGAINAEANRLPRALAAFERAAAVAPDNLHALGNAGWAATQLQLFERALAYFDRALALKSDHATARWNRGLCLLALGRFEEGLEDYEARTAIDDPRFERARRYDAPLWRKGEAVAGKRVLLTNDQGHGDTIQFIRFVRDLRRMGAQPIAEVQGALAELCASADRGLEIVRQGEALPAFDLHCPMASLPHRLGVTVATIPAYSAYLRADDARIAVWAQRLAPLRSLRVGLAWAGNGRHMNDANRSIALAQLAPMLDVAGVSFVNLQKELRAGDAEVLAERGIADHTGALSDFSETAALVANLDLVVSVDTSIAHLAGALGVPVWIFVPFAADFRWLTVRDDSPWYPSARLFRQPRFRDWASAVDAAARALADRGAGAMLRTLPGR